jgi:glycosyltransferase involved in cell wall biosynthesis
MLASVGGVDYHIMTRDRDLGDQEAFSVARRGSCTDVGGAAVWYLRCARPSDWCRAILTYRRVDIRILHMNSLFSPFFTLLPLILIRLGMLKAGRVVLAPRGELAPTALNIRRRKKRAALTFLRWTKLLQHVVIHAASDSEAEQVRSAFGPHVAGVVVAPPVANLAVRPELDRPGGQRADALELTYLSRISPIKNLLMGLQALHGVGTPVRLTIRGPVEDHGYWAACLATIAGLPSRHEVTYAGPVPAGDVADVLAKSDVFFCPTLGESFGHAIFEALAAGCRVILGSATPWTTDIDGRAGWAVDAHDPVHIAAAIEAAAASPPAERLRMRAAARAVAERWHASSVATAGWSRFLSA